MPSFQRALFLNLINQGDFYLFLIISAKAKKFIKVAATSSFYPFYQALWKFGVWAVLMSFCHLLRRSNHSAKPRSLKNSVLT